MALLTLAVGVLLAIAGVCFAFYNLVSGGVSDDLAAVQFVFVVVVVLGGTVVTVAILLAGSSF